MGSPLTWTAWLGISLRVDVQKASADGFYLETLDTPPPGTWDGRLQSAEHLLSRARVQPRSLAE